MATKYKLIYTHQAHKDHKKISSSGLGEKVEELIALISENPFQHYPPFEKLHGDQAGAYSRRINIEHRLEYEVHQEEQTIKIIRMWTHYA
ncbi:Txe/YoeB family addiction module toxin [Reichenbachiella carrageenanivorans]|uniref:Putative mRNA interferase YoeB n=1 Tax=Reichenbachiella carrageenanivorans TaxID=2979869 RepID=A0ABY6CZS5_9BACT|nr:Txe/YoeB family addiction module toxin [Reichenbachiella carrageenanivorans]UXX79421.1 Txe/YoeB family addiction module toxin [Reichenbachiella carrageenanivorans]